ncbi:MAG TPA: prephenate dehydratase [Caulobacterales bacterium]|nr:prephenate dehydratase [Caulobacterales bacterium]
MRHVISFQGERGANSDMACAQARPGWVTLPCPTFEDAFAAVSDGAAGLAMIAIENSLAGRVADIHHLLPTSGLSIVGEYFMPIHFHLMGPKGATLEGVKFVHSHVHALGQCRKIVKQLGAKTVVAGDTAGSAREIAERGDPAHASLAPPAAAEIYGLDVLAENVEDDHTNTTRFVLMAKDAEWPPADNGLCVSAFIFRVKNVPAALYKAMGGFATNGVNMTKLESYQIDGTFTATQFYAEVEGHPDHIGLKRALEELQFYCDEFRLLGVFPGAPFRTKK